MISQNNKPPIKVLIAEDQETDAFFIEQAFSKSKIENTIFLVKDGQEVVEFLEADDEERPRPDLIFLDIKMPRKDGQETLKEIKSNPDVMDIPVIMMSGSQAMEDVYTAYKNNANAYVSKGNGFEDMMAFVEAIEKFWFIKARLPQRLDS